LLQGLHFLDFVSEQHSRLEIFLANGLFQLGLQNSELVPSVLLLLSMRFFTRVFGAFMHGLEHALQRFGESSVTIRATQAAGFFEIRR
jgi:hypothetical protein